MSPIRHPARRIRRALLLAACACVLAAPAAAQSVTATSGSPEAIARIRAHFAEVEREAPGYRRTTHELTGYSLEGGVLTGFYRGGELRKLSAEHYGESGEAKEDYYFAGGRLVFVYRVDSRYDELMSGRVQSTTEHRYYFDGGRLIRYVHTLRLRPEDEAPPAPDAAEMLEEARRFAACAAATGSEPPECTAPTS